MNNKNFEGLVTDMLTLIGEDPKREGLLNTPKRVAKAYDFLTSGYNQDPQEIINQALFTTTNDEMVIVKDIDFYSMCEHHMLPIIGKAHIAYIPNGKVVGLSKLPRLVNVFARRLQIQEQLTEQIASSLKKHLSPVGVGVIIEARHMCMEMRGVEKLSSTTTSSLKGQFKNDHRTRQEFLSLIKG